MLGNLVRLTFKPRDSVYLVVEEETLLDENDLIPPREVVHLLGDDGVFTAHKKHVELIK